MIKKWWNNKSKEQKKWFLIKTISVSLFLIIGLVFGIVSLYASGWNITKFILNPTVDLVMLILLALMIFCLSLKVKE